MKKIFSITISLEILKIGFLKASDEELGIFSQAELNFLQHDFEQVKNEHNYANTNLESTKDIVLHSNSHVELHNVPFVKESMQFSYDSSKHSVSNFANLGISYSSENNNETQNQLDCKDDLSFEKPNTHYLDLFNSMHDF